MEGEPTIQLGGRGNVNGVVATVYGASGMLGRGVVEMLGQCGSQVVCPYRDDGMESRDLKLMGDLGQIIPMPFDMSEPETVSKTMERSNVIVNCIGNQFQTTNYKYHDSHVKVPYRMAKLAKEAGVERFIHVSANGASHDSPSDFLKSKAEGEDWVREVYPDAVIVRPCNMWGTRDKFLTRIAKILDISPVFPRGNKDQKLAPVFFADVAEAIRNIVLDPSTNGKIFELGGPKQLTYEQVVDVVQRDIYREDDRTVVDIHPEIAYKIGQAMEFLPNRFKFMTRDMVTRETLDNVPSGDYDGLAELDVKPADMTVSARNMLLLYARNRAPQRWGLRKDIIGENDWYRA